MFVALHLLQVVVAVEPAINITKCLQEHCTPQVSACTKDAKCDAGIKCVIACPKPATKQCAQACITKDLDQAMLEVGLCAEMNKCIPSFGMATDGAICRNVDAEICRSPSRSQACSWCEDQNKTLPSECVPKFDARQMPKTNYRCFGVEPDLLQ